MNNELRSGDTSRPDTGVPTAKQFFDGAWVDGAGEEIAITGPANGREVTRSRTADLEQVQATVAAAREAQPGWAALPMPAKAEILHEALDSVEGQCDEIAHWATVETGRAIKESRAEVQVGVAISRQLIEDALRFAGETRESGFAHVTRRVLTIHQPIGVTALFSPFCFPIEMILNCVASLMVGNTAIWKPSEAAPYTAALTTSALVEADIPRGVMNLLLGGPITGEQIVEHPDVGLVLLMGSTETGEKVTRAAGVKRLLLELSGAGPVVVMDDADIDAAVENTIVDCFYQAGQVCTAAERILVHESIYDSYVTKLTERVAQINVGDPLDESTDMGTLCTAEGLDTVVRHIEDAKQRGATVVAGGTHDGLQVQPTIITGVTSDMEVAREVTFGPVAPIMKFGSADEALAMANSVPYGLSMAVFTSSLETAWRMAEGFEAGQVNINAGTNSWELNGPFGGWKKSGIGREMGAEGFRCLTNVKTVTFDLTP